MVIGNIRKTEPETKEQTIDLDAANVFAQTSVAFGEAPEEKKKKERSSLLDSLKVNSRSETTVTIALAAAAYILSFYIIGSILIAVKYFGKPYKADLYLKPWEFPKTLLFNGSLSIFWATLILAVLIAYAVGAYYLYRIRLRDNDYVIRSKKGIYGNANWLGNEPKELRATLDVSENMKRPGYIPLGIYKGRVYSVPQKPTYEQFKNLNICIIGSSGIGKSFAFIGPLIQSRIAYGESFAVTDTKGDILRTYGKVCEKFGFNVMVFNTKDWEYSDSWDCLSDLANASEKLIYDYVDIYSNVFIQNTSDGERPDYWQKNEHDLLRALMHLVTRDRSYEGRRTFKALIDLINSPEEEIRSQLETAEDKVQNAARSILSNSDAKLRENYRSGLANRLQIFRSKLVAEALSVPGIDFKKAVNEPTAIFIITRDDNSAYDAVTSLFIACLYSKLVEISNSSEYEGKLKVPFWIITDELCNMAAINDLSKKISTNRSRNIRLCLAVQSISQLDNKYKGLAHNIVSNCGIVVFLGSDDDDTVNYVVKRCGKYTQLVHRKTVERNAIMRRLTFHLHYKEMDSEVQKNLIEEYEASKFPTGRVIYMILGKSPFKCKSYPEPQHEVYEYVEKTSIADRKPLWFQEFCRANPDFEQEEEKFIPSEYERSEHTPSYTPEENRIKRQFANIPPEARYASSDVMEEIARKRLQARRDAEERIRAQFAADEERPTEKPENRPAIRKAEETDSDAVRQITAEVPEESSDTNAENEAFREIVEGRADEAMEGSFSDPVVTQPGELEPPDPFQGNDAIMNELFDI